MNEALEQSERTQSQCMIETAGAIRTPQAAASVPVIPLMSREEGGRLISQMPKRSLQEALEMKERMLGRL